MTTKQMVVGIVAGLSLFTACSQGTPAVPVPAATAGSTAPASSAPAPASGGIAVDDFMGKIVAAQKAVKTYTTDMSMETALLGKPTKMVMKGAVDQTDPSNISMSMDMDLGGMAMKTLKVGGDMYLQMGATGKKWMKVPKDQMAQYDSTTDSADITTGMEKAKAAMKAIELVGSESIDGVATQHYKITLDPAGLAKMTGSDAKISGDTFAYDIWVDDASLLRKVSMNVKAEVDGKKIPMTVNGVMGHYNEPVTITAPDKDDIVEIGG